MEDADLIRNQIAMLERALFALQLDGPEDDTEDDLSWLNLRYIDDGEDDDDSEDDLAVSLVKSGLAKKILGKDNVTSGAA